MASKGRMLAGCTVALVTPFQDGEVDYQALRDSVEWQISQGTPVLSPVGTTGECPTLSHDEHETSDRRGGRTIRWAGKGDGGDRVERHVGSDSPDQVRRESRSRRRAPGFALL